MLEGSEVGLIMGGVAGVVSVSGCFPDRICSRTGLHRSCRRKEAHRLMAINCFI